MAGPGPHFITSLNDANQRACENVVAASVAKHTAPSNSEPVATGDALIAANRLCIRAGLSCDWVTLRARAITLGLRIPGQAFVKAADGSSEEWVADDPQRIRAYCTLYAADLIDPVAEQTPEAVREWRWW